MNSFAPSSPVCFISTHLDDVALSCGYFLFDHPGVTVITVLAGAPDKYGDPNEWNARTTGKVYAPDAMKMRIKEDSVAMDFLKARPIYLDGWDLPYLESQPRDGEILLKKLVGIVNRRRFKSIIIPLGFHHPDHIAVSDLCLRLVEKVSADIYFYLDLPYGISFPREAKEKIAVIERFGSLEELSPLDVEGPVKDKIFKFYRSQYYAIKEEFKNAKAFEKSLQSQEYYWLLHKRKSNKIKGFVTYSGKKLGSLWRRG